MQAGGSGVPCTPLSPTYQSSQLLTPRDLTRITTERPKYSSYQRDVLLQTKPHSSRVPGGVPVQFGQHPILLERDHPVEQFYDNTSLSLSTVRAHDQIMPRPLSSRAVVDKEIHRDFPTEHPYSSHQERFRVFPDTRREVDSAHFHKDLVEVPLCRVVDRAQFKSCRREEVGYYRPFSASSRREDVELLRLTSRAGSTRHKRSPTYPFIVPLTGSLNKPDYCLPPVTPSTKEGLSSAHRARMHTSYQSHFPRYTSSCYSPNVLHLSGSDTPQHCQPPPTTTRPLTDGTHLPLPLPEEEEEEEGGEGPGENRRRGVVVVDGDAVAMGESQKRNDQKGSEEKRDSKVDRQSSEPDIARLEDTSESENDANSHNRQQSDQEHWPYRADKEAVSWKKSSTFQGNASDGSEEVGRSEPFSFRPSRQRLSEEEEEKGVRPPGQRAKDWPAEGQPHSPWSRDGEDQWTADDTEESRRQYTQRDTAQLPDIAQPPPTSSTPWTLAPPTRGHLDSPVPRNIASSQRYAELCSRFSRSGAMEMFHSQFRDQLPDLREASREGRRHFINGYHAYHYH